ncbi:integrase [Candidatus Magnetomorum sp. HK-1]|nr:integrase [Candidatus Magnetomorum sp. HK-1]
MALVEKMYTFDISKKSLDDQFFILLHKKIMDKKGSAKRRAKKYYMDQYKKTGIIPKPLILAGQGIMEGRKYSGRNSSLSSKIKERFLKMVKGSCDPNNPDFIFITQKARKITVYHKFLEEEFQQKVSIHALRRLVREKHLDLLLNEPDFNESQEEKGYFNPEEVFNLVQVDGCQFQYLKIKNENGDFLKPQVIEFYDTGSRYMFVLECYFSESSLNSVDLFRKFLLSAPFPQKKIRIRPDNAKGFLNLKRPIRELNLKYSLPDKFYMDPDFSAVRSPKNKVHLESSHRRVHDFEIRIIKKFENKIVKLEPGYVFKGNKKLKVTITCLDITIEELRQSKLIEKYKTEHNENSHRFSEEGKIQKWVPKEKFQKYISSQQIINFDYSDIKDLLKYGFEKKTATVSKDKTIEKNKRKYVVVVGADKFSSHKSTKVKISEYNDKLYIFEDKKDGICIGEAVSQKRSKKPDSVVKKEAERLEKNEIELISDYLARKNMCVDMKPLIAYYKRGLTLNIAKTIFEKNMERYDEVIINLKDMTKIGFVRFNAFLMDCKRYQENGQDK